MEDSSTTDDTLRLFRELRDAGHGPRGVGPVLQAALQANGSRTQPHSVGASVRLCKGIYIEPAKVAFMATSTRSGPASCATLDVLLDGGCYVGIATHDEWLVSPAPRRPVRERGLQPDAYEFQMLLGVRSGARRPDPSPTATAFGFTCPTAASGTDSPSGGCRRTRRSPATSPAIWDVRCFAGVRAPEVAALEQLRPARPRSSRGGAARPRRRSCGAGTRPSSTRRSSR